MCNMQIYVDILVNISRLYIYIYWSTIWYCKCVLSQFLFNTSNTFHSMFCEMFVWQVFIVAEHLFCTYFLVKWCVRFGAFENKRHLAQFLKSFRVLDWHFTRHLRWLFAGFLVAFWWLADVCYCFWARDLSLMCFFGVFLAITFWGLGWCNSSWRSGSEDFISLQVLSSANFLPFKVFQYLISYLFSFASPWICELFWPYPELIFYRGGHRWRKAMFLLWKIWRSPHIRAFPGPTARAWFAWSACCGSSASHASPGSRSRDCRGFGCHIPPMISIDNH